MSPFTYILILTVSLLSTSITVKSLATTDLLAKLNSLQEKYEQLQLKLEANSLELRSNFQLIQNLQTELQNLREDPVPIGFLYTEYPGEIAPQVLWPAQTWTDISSNFAGHFFRVVGGNASEFGQSQEGSTGGVLEAKNYYLSCIEGVCATPSDTVALSNDNPLTTPSHRTAQLFTGLNDDKIIPYGAHLDFLVSDQETRPVNMAVRIWRRTA